ncbi:hypothetical protein SNEBB_003038 [Seison nebaliae]|nr:hypothetical protein SNEBB_003038 [Seison nebaliae]
MTSALMNEPSTNYNTIDDNRFSSTTNLEASDDYEDDMHASQIIREIKELPAANRKTTDMETIMHIIKANIGSGILALPYAVMHAGLLLGLFGLLFLALVTTYCMALVVKCAHYLRAKTGIQELDYGNVVKQSLKCGPNLWLIKNAKYGKALVNITLLVTQIGFCCVYIVFIASNMKDVIEIATEFEMNVRIYIIIITVLLVPYCMITNLKILAPFSLVANIIIVVGLGIILQCIVRNPLPWSKIPFVESVDKYPIFFGTVMFTFEGIGLILPIENNMEHPDRLLNWNGVLNTSMATVVILYCGMAFYGSIKYGELIRDSITLNLPASMFYDSVRVMFAIVIFITYNLQLYVAVEILWTFIKRKMFRNRSDKYHRNGEYVFRTLLIAFSAVMALAIPHLGLFISLVGSISCSAMSLIFPPLIDLYTFWSTYETKRMKIWKIASSVTILLIGIVGTFVGTISTIDEIIKVSTQSHNSSSITHNGY